VISGFQIRAGRALLQWTARRLAAECGVAKTTIERIEAKADTWMCRTRTLASIETVFGRHGVELKFGGAIRSKRQAETRDQVATLPSMPG
jgi:DNA-binding XRE family transcriptional regulator